MKILVCGAGRITDELLKRVGENWHITLIDKQQTKLAPYAHRFPSVVRLMSEDASSPVVLEQAALADQDCVLALTNDDAANLAVARFAREAQVNNVLAVVRDPERLPAFHELDVWTVSMPSDAARKVHQFLKDPRLRIIDLGEGEGELLEMTVGRQELSRLRNVVTRREDDWRLAGILRGGELLYPDALGEVAEGDRLLILGRSELYNLFSSRLAEDQLHFPRTYGRQMVLEIGDDPSLDVTELLNEAFYLAQGTLTEQIKIVCEKPAAEMRAALARWSESLQIEALDGSGKIRQRVAAAAETNDAGIVVTAFTRRSFWPWLFGSGYLRLAAKLPAPLLLAKFSDPYESLLVPFNGSLAAQRALEIAMDLARQIDAAVAVIVVVEPSFLRGDSSATGQWERDILKQVRQLSHVHKLEVAEQVRQGNPVREILAIAGDHQLLVLPTGETTPGLFSVDVAALLAERAPCSVLLVG